MKPHSRQEPVHMVELHIPHGKCWIKGTRAAHLLGPSKCQWAFWDNRQSNIRAGSLIEQPFIWQLSSLHLSPCAVQSAQTQCALFLRPWASFLGCHYWHFPPPSCGPSSHLSWLLLNSQLSFAAVDQWLSTPPVSYWQSKQPSSSKWVSLSFSIY